jgi:hypothetical protein
MKIAQIAPLYEEGKKLKFSCKVGTGFSGSFCALCPRTWAKFELKVVHFPTFRQLVGTVGIKGWQPRR